MAPQYTEGDEVVVLKKRRVGVKDVVVFKHKNTLFIKRVVRVLKEGIYVVGDNMNDSLDSRKLGLVKKNDIIGKVLFKL